MQLYVTREYRHHGFGEIETYYKFGRIEEREVDSFNGEIKVFVSMGTIESFKIRMFPYNPESDEDVSLDLDNNNFEHISGLGLSKASKGQVEKIKKAIEYEASKHESQARIAREFLEKL